MYLMDLTSPGLQTPHPSARTSLGNAELLENNFRGPEAANSSTETLAFPCPCVEIVGDSSKGFSESRVTLPEDGDDDEELSGNRGVKLDRGYCRKILSGVFAV